MSRDEDALALYAVLAAFDDLEWSPRREHLKEHAHLSDEAFAAAEKWLVDRGHVVVVDRSYLILVAAPAGLPVVSPSHLIVSSVDLEDDA